MLAVVMVVMVVVVVVVLPPSWCVNETASLISQAIRTRLYELIAHCMLFLRLLKGMFIFIYLLVPPALNPRGYCRARRGGDGGLGR